MSLLFGLRNDSTFCYFNALVQALVSCEKFNEILLNHQSQKELNPEGSLFQSYVNFLRTVMGSEQVKQLNEKGKSPTVNPIGLKRIVLEKSDGKFQVGEQGDASELLITFLDGIHEEIKETWDTLPSDMKEVNLSHSGSSLENYINSYREGYSPIAKLFHIQSKTRLNCPCGFTLSRYEISSVLNLEVKPQNKSLRDCFINSFGSPETLDGYTCDSCQLKGKTRRYNSLSYVPLYLIIVLKKYQNPQQKLKISSDQTLPVYELFHREDLQRLNKAYDTQMEKKYEYRLQSAIIHMGSLRGGHYNIITKRDREWSLIDDEHITRIPKMESTYLEHAYILIYRRKKISE